MSQLDDLQQSQARNALESLHTNAILSSLAGFPFLLIFSIVWFAGGILTYQVPSDIAPWIYANLGGPATLLAIFLERRIGYVKGNNNPLSSLSLQILFVQIVAFPAAFLVYEGLPAYTPVALAALVGGHFLPFQWVYKTKLYSYLGIITSLGSLAIAIIFGMDALHYTGFFMGITLFIGALLAKRHAKNIWLKHLAK